MIISITVETDEDLGLLQWLRADPVSRQVAIEPKPSGEWLGASEIIIAVVGDAIALSQLIFAVAVFRNAQRGRGNQPPDISLRRGTVEEPITTDDEAEIDRISDALAGAEDDPEIDDSEDSL